MIQRRVELCNPGRLKMQINYGRRGKSIFTGNQVWVLMCIILFYLGDFRICEDVDKKSWICCVFSQSNINFKVFELSKNRRTCDINTQRNVIMFNHNVKRVSRTHAEWFIAGTIFNAHIFSTCYLSPGPHLFEIIPFDFTSISSISLNTVQLKFRNTNNSQAYLFVLSSSHTSLISNVKAF